MSLETPEKIRSFQRKLYCKAKAEPAFRFYLLYDKICREDILRHAYALARANAGVPRHSNVVIPNNSIGVLRNRNVLISMSAVLLSRLSGGLCERCNMHANQRQKTIMSLCFQSFAEK